MTFPFDSTEFNPSLLAKPMRTSEMCRLSFAAVARVRRVAAALHDVCCPVVAAYLAVTDGEQGQPGLERIA